MVMARCRSSLRLAFTSAPLARSFVISFVIGPLSRVHLYRGMPINNMAWSVRGVPSDLGVGFSRSSRDKQRRVRPVG